jgi:undecaprenyl diphosphate synthase
VQATRRVVEHCIQRDIEILTLFAFSSENWKRPAGEVSTLMELFCSTLRKEIGRLSEQGVRVKFLGDVAAFPDSLRAEIVQAEAETASNSGLKLNIAVNYGGRWDIIQAVQGLARDVVSGGLSPGDISAELLSSKLSTAGMREPDLFIRTGGETRVSNFLLWQLAYTELVFSEVLWPDFDQACLDAALAEYAGRQRRYGRITEQIDGGAGDA